MNPGEQSGQLCSSEWAMEARYSWEVARNSGLGHGSQAHLVVRPVEDSKVLADEDIPQDPELSGGSGEVHALEAAGTALLVLEQRRRRWEMQYRFSSGRYRGLSIKGPGPLQGGCREQLPAHVWVWLFLAWGPPRLALHCTTGFQGSLDFIQCFWQGHNP